MVIQGSPPTPQLIYYYVLTGEGGWSYNQFNTVNLISMCVCSIALVFIASKAEKIKFWRVMLYASIIMNISIAALTIVLFSDQFSVPLFILIYGSILSVNVCPLNMVFVPVVGRISKHIPEGFESTGVTLVVAANQLATNFNSSLLSVWTLAAYHVESGYYSGLRGPQMITNWLSVLEILSAPAFLWTG